jgi:hypothetical protein
MILEFLCNSDLTFDHFPANIMKDPSDDYRIYPQLTFLGSFSISSVSGIVIPNLGN